MPTEVRDRVLGACLSFMVPVARFLLRVGLSYREFDHVARCAFVRVASEEYGIRGRPTNLSRVSAMTGIPRRNIKAIRESVTDYAFDRRTELSPLADALHLWHSDPRYLDERGAPKKLPLTGAESSFESLVRCCANGLPVGAIRVELLRSGAVTEDEAGLLSLTRRHVVPESGEKKLVTSLSFSFQALASTIAHNANPERRGPGRIERFVESNPVSGESAVRLREILRARIVRFTEEVDDLFASENSSEPRGTKRVGVGVFFHEDEN
jgi:hypothetical protein